MKKQDVTGLEGKALELATAFNSAVDHIEGLEQKSAGFESLKTEIATLKENAKGTDLEAKMLQLETDFAKRANEIETKMASKNSKNEDSFVSPATAFLNLLEQKGIKSFADLAKFKSEFKDGIEVKADPILTSDYTGDVSRTQEVSAVKFPLLRPLAFIPNVRGGSVTNGKSILMWTPASYVANTGYAGEGVNTVSENQAAATEKYRKMAKISAKQYMSAETFEDLPQFAQRLQEQLYANAQLFLDTKIYDGDGNDSTQPNHIYGIKTQGSTAFDAVNAIDVKMPNLGDLVDACATQAEVSFYTVDTVWMHPKTANKYRRTKDTTGQYIINKLITGEEVMGGLTVIRSVAIGEDELLVANKALIQLWTKRSMTIKIGQFGTDVELDLYSAILFARAQVLVEDEEKKGVIYVSSILNALAAIEEQNA